MQVEPNQPSSTGSPYHPRPRLYADGELTDEQLAQLRELLVDAFEGDFAEADWEHTFGGFRIVAYADGQPVSHAAVVPRVIRVGDTPFKAGYVEGVATLRSAQRHGLGSRIMADTTRVVGEHFELGVLSTGVHDFYARHGWEPWRGPSYVHDGSELIRTEDEDDGLMVLRFGPSASVDLAAAITCERRSGDDW